MAASLAVRISFERSARSASLPLRCSSVDCLGTIFTATWSENDQYQPSELMDDGEKPTCSPVSMFLAILTLPMLPAPMVFPRAHVPVGVVMVVRRLGWIELAGGRCEAGTG